MESSSRTSLNFSKAFVRRKYNSAAVKEYRAQSPAILQKHLLERCQSGHDLSESWSKTVFGCVLLADISGFTKLACKVKAEDLKAYINEFFTLLVGKVIKKYGGDVIKFCGDAMLVTWTCSQYSYASARKECLVKATDCALDLLEKCDNFSSGVMPSDVHLRLHCGLSSGELHLMALGNAERMEFLVSGSLLRELGETEAVAEPGDLCVCYESYNIIRDDYDAVLLPSGVKIVEKKMKDYAPSRCVPFMFPRVRKRNSKKLSRVYLRQDSTERAESAEEAIENADSNELKNLLQHFTAQQSKTYKKALISYVHNTARRAILNKTSDHLAELRQVVTIFIQIMNLDDDFDSGNHRRPQLAFLQILDAMDRLDGTVRQFVVDDKGCVIICAFGLPGFSSFNDSSRAVSAALGIRDSLLKLNISCRIGIAQGMAYCGYVGSKQRKEYCIVGASVNLAARLMSQSQVSQVLVDGSVFLVAQDDFTFDELPKIIAKGYNAPVKVFAPRTPTVEGTLDEVARRSNTMKHPLLIGRSTEVMRLQRAVYDFSVYPVSIAAASAQSDAKKKLLEEDEETKEKKSYSALCVDRYSYLKSDTAEICSHDSGDDDNHDDTKNKVIVVGCAGYGKTAIITEIIRRNFLALFTMARVTCHVANMYEPYESLTQIVKSLLLDTSSEVSGVLSPKLQSSFKYDSNLSLIDDEEYEEGDASESQEVKSDAEKSTFENEIREEVFTTVHAIASKFLPLITIEIIDRMARSRGESLLSTKGVTAVGVCGDDEERSVMDDYGHHCCDDDFSTSEQGQSSPASSECQVILHRSAVTAEKRSRSNDSVFYTLSELLPLLRICFNANPHSVGELRETLEEKGSLHEIINVLAAEVLRVMVPLTKSRALVVEDLQWCDKPSFRVLTKMLNYFPSGLFIGSIRPSEKGVALFSHKFARIASFEGSVEVNSIDDISRMCQLVSLEPFGRSEVMAVIEYILGEKIITANPNVKSESTISKILAKSEHGMVGKVFEQVRLLESDILKAKYGVGKLHNIVIGQQQFDRLQNESQVIVKMASVCGTTFTLAMLAHVLEKMGYVSIATHLLTTLCELEEKGIVKRIFAVNRAQGNTSSDGDALIRMSRSYSQRRLGILSNSDKLLFNEDKLFTFLNKTFRESVYSIMLESQRAAVHAVIGAKLAREYMDAYNESTSIKEHTELAEALAFHFSRANDMPNEIKYALETAKISKEGHMIATSFEYLQRVVLLCTQQKSCQQVIAEIYSLPPAMQQKDVFKEVLTNRRDFGCALSSQMYVPIEALLGDVKSSCPLISDLKLSEYVAELSILEYMQSELTTSHNFAMLAQHMRKLTRYARFPGVMRQTLRNAASRLQFGLMYFYQGDLYLMRGHLPEAIDYLCRAAALVPASVGAHRAQICCMLSTAELLNGSSASKYWMTQAHQIHMLDRTKAPYAYVQLHTGILSAVVGNFSLAEATMGKGATRVLVRKDCSPLCTQIHTLINWIQFITGRPDLVIEAMRTIYAEENGLKKIWSFELLVVIYAMQGRYLRCYEILQKLKAIQSGRYGTAFHSALFGFVGTMDGKHMSPLADDRDEVLTALLFAGEKLSVQTQTSPVGIMCLFCTCFSLLSILHPSVISHVCANFRPGGGMITRLTSCLQKTMKAFEILSKRIPFLSLLNSALLMKQAVVVNRPSSRFGKNFSITSLMMLYPEFTFGKAMLALQWRVYVSTFVETPAEVYELLEQESIHTFGIPDNHFLYQAYKA